MTADDFYTATVSAAFGGTTTVICFCAQHRTDSIPVVLKDYAERARTKAVIDYGFHLIIANPDEVVPNNNMKPFKGVPDAEVRKKIVASLKSGSGSG